MKYKWLLFDLDGTLFDYDKSEKIAFQNTFNDFGLGYQDEYLNFYDSINKKLWEKFELGEIEVSVLKIERFELLLNKIGHNKNAEEFSRKYQTNLSKCTFLLDGVEDMLYELEGSFNMMLITNGLKAVQRPRLKNSSIKKYFSDIVISEEVGSAKPNSGIFETAFAKMGHPPKQDVLMIGDSLTSDITGGVAFGLDTCWLNSAGVSSNGLKPTFEISRISELKNFLIQKPGMNLNG